MKHLSSGRGNLQISRIGIKDKNSVLRDLELAKKKLSVLPEAVVVAVKNGQLVALRLAVKITVNQFWL